MRVELGAQPRPSRGHVQPVPCLQPRHVSPAAPALGPGPPRAGTARGSAARPQGAAGPRRLVSTCPTSGHLIAADKARQRAPAGATGQRAHPHRERPKKCRVGFPPFCRTRRHGPGRLGSRAGSGDGSSLPGGRPGPGREWPASASQRRVTPARARGPKDSFVRPRQSRALCVF